MRAFLNSFRYAAKGMRVAIKEERNLRVHFCIAFYVYMLSLFYPFGKVEYCILTICVAGVIAMELLNSSLERTVHAPSPGRYQMAGAVKDIAAAAVLMFSTGAAVCGIVLFWDVEVFKKIGAFFAANLLCIIPLAVSLAFWVWFVFFFGKRREKP